ncbi:MAG: undecaprenyl-phosphate glucose phosphotransferase [Gammaproteobacteria bacterium]|nr:undecaprenyl-phosphate glucose phosphotransferase [Gammaproteobacteria bacterium]
MDSKEFNHHRHQTTNQLFGLFDLIGIAFSLLLAMWIYGISISIYYISAGTSAMLCFILIAGLTNLYHTEPARALKGRTDLVILSSFLTFIVLLIFSYLTKTTGYYSRVTISLWFLLMPAVLIGWRLVAYRLHLSRFKNKKNFKRVAILGANEMGDDIANEIQKDITLGYQFVGFYEDRATTDDRSVKSLCGPVMGSFDDVIKDAHAKKISILYIALPLAAEKRIIKLLDDLSDCAIAVHIIPNFFMYNILHSRWHSVGDHQALSIYDTPFYGVGSLLKKAEDMVIASIILVLISLPMSLIAIAIKLTSPGPIIFKQKRYGINGKEVIVYKFRSMTTCDNSNEIKQATKDDARITRLGAFLRKTSLDELPQFLNVLQGSMSIVGPRPHAIAHNEEYRQQIGSYMLRHMVKPGITGWAQVNGLRGETKLLEQMEKRVEYDLNYIRNWSFMWDIKIILMTIFKGFVNKNAY